ncbi:alpha/beta hydrolase [Streptomyces sp. ODS28]|uniref:alpha/beta hydrolase n=1 Tax=Streptomyces sp. ODS28 TaxID=3136688 RepID=UPI0031E8B218
MTTRRTEKEQAAASRRRVLGGGLGLAAGGVLGVAGGAQAASAAGHSGHGATFVLVHGTHSAGAYWEPLARELALRGHRTIAVDQPLHGAAAFVPVAYQTQDLRALATERSPVARLTLDDFERRVTETVRRAARTARGGRVVLVGHSLGGLSVSRVAEAVPELLHHIGYMAAFCPSRRMPSADACTASPEGQRALNPGPYVVGDPDRLGVLRLDFRTGKAETLAFFKAMICANVDDNAFRQLLSTMQTDESTTVYAGAAVGSAGRWGRVPRTYLRFGRDRTIAPELQDRMIAEADAATGRNRFRVRDFPAASHIGPREKSELVDALAGLAE